MGLGPNWHQIGSKICQNQKLVKLYVEKKISVLKGLKVSPLACKRVFYKP